MPDREKVIHILDCILNNHEGTCRDGKFGVCPYEDLCFGDEDDYFLILSKNMIETIFAILLESDVPEPPKGEDNEIKR